ncbi:hypothetical protein, partial [Photorhabdus temperata]|uniref:hypothetical protein n=1 Tax=Photorhabdus temperata TaxID=574560 RepID=UPI001E410E21
MFKKLTLLKLAKAIIKHKHKIRLLTKCWFFIRHFVLIKFRSLNGACRHVKTPPLSRLSRQKRSRLTSWCLKI